jgi:radical SAM superfamily enzyme YgiQ (UPF0313 family)
MISSVLLINPWLGEIFPPPSLGYIQSAIQTIPGVNVTAMDIDCAFENNNDFDAIAVSFHSFSVKHARAIRERWPHARMIAGGHHPSALPEQLLSIGYDQIVVGEGENAIISIINGNIDTIVNGDPVDVNKVSPPNYAGFRGDWSMGFPIISSRGCPFDCTFCASAIFWHRKWRMRSSENVLVEIYAMPGKKFMFEDDNFTNHRGRTLEICAGLNGRGYTWQCASRADVLRDVDLCRALKNAGCHTVWLGIESLSQRSLDRNHKGTTVDRMLDGIETAESIGLHTMSQFIVGLPDDDQSDIDETVRNIGRSRIARRGCNTLWILPNTAIHTKAKTFGFTDDVYLDTGAPFYTYEQSIQTLNTWTHQINNA